MVEQIDTTQRDELVEIVADIVSAYVSKNPVHRDDLPQLIESVHSSVATLVSGTGPALTEAPTPAVPVRSSVKKDHIVCLVCGRKFKSLKRHLSANHDLTPQEYREKWSLPDSYPLVAPNYSAARSEMAVRLGLGRKPHARRSKKR